MITNFEEITDDLTDDEKKLIPGFVAAFKKRIGKENAITSTEIIQRYAAINIYLSAPRVRAIIHWLRDGWLVPGLVATSVGYYVSTDPEEVNEYINSLKQRNRSVQEIITRMEQYLKQIQ